MRSLDLGRSRLAEVADWLATAAVISLPWSASATSALIVLWVLAAITSIDLRTFPRMLCIPAAALPIVLYTLGQVGTLWADVPWLDRIGGYDSFPKFLAIPLLFSQFQRSTHGRWMLAGFVLSGCALLIVSWYLVLAPHPLWQAKDVGVLVKDRISQGSVFVICIFALLELAAIAWKEDRVRSAVLLALLAAVFLLNTIFVTVTRTSVVTIPILCLVFAATHFPRRWMIIFLAALVAVGVVAWVSSPYLRYRVTSIPEEIAMFEAAGRNTSAGARVEFWKDSIQILREAPMIGHGTGSINAEFARVIGPRSSATNPHNQLLAVGIQLGIIGIVALVAMWAAHLRLFASSLSKSSLAARIGLIIVLQNVVGSMFNSHLFDFTHGWIYVFGVGTAGGIVLRNRLG